MVSTRMTELFLEKGGGQQLQEKWKNSFLSDFFPIGFIPSVGAGGGGDSTASFVLHVGNGKPSLMISGSFPTHELFIWSGKAGDR